MARPKKYTKKTLDEKVREYFASISREVTATERIATGEKDADGHSVYEERVIINSLGKPVTYTEYVLPPTISGLCEFLGITRQTWDNYCGQKQFFDTTTYAQGRRRAYLEKELLTRKGANLRGIEFDLRNNCGWTEQVTVETGERASRALESAAIPLSDKRALLEEIARLYGGGQEAVADEGDADE